MRAHVKCVCERVCGILLVVLWNCVLRCALLCHVMSWSLILTSIHMNQSLVWMRSLSPCIGFYEREFIHIYSHAKSKLRKWCGRVRESCRFQTQTISIIMYGPVGKMPPQWFTRACVLVYLWEYFDICKFRLLSLEPRSSSSWLGVAWLGFALELYINNAQHSWALFS